MSHLLYPDRVAAALRNPTDYLRQPRTPQNDAPITCDNDDRPAHVVIAGQRLCAACALRITRKRVTL